jgi:pyruvate,orthophosphate dikinase
VAEVARRSGTPPIPEVMVPLVATRAELDIVRDRIVATAQAVEKEMGARLDYLVGTMIELPRAALRAGDIARTAEFFSFGTNDLTQTTFGISRDDSARFLGEYTAKGVIKTDPFVSLDTEGVGELVQIAAERGKATSMAAIRHRSDSARKWAWTMYPARPSGCPLRGSRPPRPPSQIVAELRRYNPLKPC